jgi:hypothetical protein
MSPMPNLADKPPSAQTPARRGRPPGGDRNPYAQPQGVRDPEILLALAVLSRSILDVFGLSQVAKANVPPSRRDQFQANLQADARQFVQADNLALLFWCAVAGVEPTAFVVVARHPPSDSLAGQLLRGGPYGQATGPV